VATTGSEVVEEDDDDDDVDGAATPSVSIVSAP
jgi:hypothetical protein